MFRAALSVLVLLVAFERPAGAYLDPGTGSMLLQVLLGGFAAVGVLARLYWHRLTAVFVRVATSQTLTARRRLRHLARRRPIPARSAPQMIAQEPSAPFDTGSFRDPDTRVFYYNEAVFRCLTARALEDWERLATTDFHARLMADRRLIPTRLVSDIKSLPPLASRWVGGSGARAGTRGVVPLRVVRSACSRTPHCCSST